MSCWTRTTVLRIPAIFLGFEYWQEWEDFLDAHEEDFHFRTGCFSAAICHRLDDCPKWLYDSSEPWDRLDMDLYPTQSRPYRGLSWTIILKKSPLFRLKRTPAIKTTLQGR